MLVRLGSTCGHVRLMFVSLSASVTWVITCAHTQTLYPPYWSIPVSEWMMAINTRMMQLSQGTECLSD